MKSSKIARVFELAKLAAQVGLKEVGSPDLKTRLEQAALIVNSLSQLKGAAMKAGQILSLDLNQYFPPEVIALLSQLQNQAVAHPTGEIEKILKLELGENIFRQISPIGAAPIGAASIGQVHRARYRDQEIALKVQYPGVDTSIDSDLKILKTIASSFCQLTGRKMDLNPLFTECRRILESEVNYEKEAEFQMLYRELASRLISTSGFSYRVPAVIAELSTKKVLGMSFETGLGLRQWMNKRPPGSVRANLGTAILDLYFHEFFEWGLVQTDPNWANFLVDENPEKQDVVLLDFGACRMYSREFIQNYICLLELASRNQSVALKDLAIQMELIDKRESASAFSAFERLLRSAIEPFLKQSARFDFGDKSYLTTSNSATKELSGELLYSPPPYNLVFLHRKLAGVYSILKSLDVELDVSAYWEKMRELAHRSPSNPPHEKH